MLVNDQTHQECSISATIDAIRSADCNELLNQDYVVKLVCKMGLRWSPIEYSQTYHSHMLENRGGQVRGIWQEPTQFAQALLLLAKGKFGIKSIISIGTFNGWTDIFLLFYLSRFYELDRFTSLDPYTYVEGKPDKYSFDPDVKKVLAAYNISIYEQLQLTSNELSAVCDVKSDFCMIDGLHTYGAVSTDWENVGKQAKICWFHDVNNHLVGFQNAPLFWKSNIEPFYETVKFLHDDDGMNRFGIGLKLPREHATAEGMKQVANPIQ